MKRGVLIAFEGVEGSGKTTQAELLYEFLKDKNYNCLFTREPGGTPIGERIREILLDPHSTPMHPKTELLLYLASRAQHTYDKIMPALKEGFIVICDRFTDSSFAYQGAARGLGLKPVSRLNKFACAGIKPDLTILVDLPVSEGFKRQQGEPDRLEKEGSSFHEQVREGFLALSRRAPGRIKVFDGRKDKETLHREIREKVADFLAKRK
jgi:dTMP kinase